jgi:hypothetical protein
MTWKTVEMFMVVIGAEGLRYSMLDGGLIPLQSQEDASFLNQDMIVTTTNQVLRCILFFFRHCGDLSAILIICNSNNSTS